MKQLLLLLLLLLLRASQDRYVEVDIDVTTCRTAGFIVQVRICLNRGQWSGVGWGGHAGILSSIFCSPSVV